MRVQPLAIGIAQDVQRARAWPHEDLLVRPAFPGRTVRVHAGKRAGNGSAVGKRLVTAAQPVVRLHAREAHQRVFAAERELAQPLQHVVARCPVRGRVDEEQRALVAAELLGDEQHARAGIAIPRRRRQAQEVQVFDRPQREQPGATFRGADQVVVRQRSAVIAVRIGVDVTDRMSRAGTERAVGAGRWHVSTHAHEHRLLQRVRDMARGAGHHRQSPEDFLVLDVLGAARPHSLDDEVEAVVLARGDVVVVDRGTQHLARAGTQRFERQRLATDQDDLFDIVPGLLQQLLDRPVADRACLLDDVRRALVQLLPCQL